MSEREKVHELADELFAAIERSQGFAHVSDGETFPTVEAFFERIRGRLEHQRKGARIMADFLRRHNQLIGAKDSDQ